MSDAPAGGLQWNPGSQSRYISQRKWVIFFTLAPVCTIALLLGVIALNLRTRWASFTKARDEGIARQKSVTGERRPLSGTPLPGNAWDAYEPVVPVLDKLWAAHNIQVFRPFYVPPLTEEEESELNAFLRQSAAQLDQLAAATRCERAARAIPWESGLDQPRQWRSPHVTSADLLFADARRRRLLGDRDGALDRLAAGFQLAVDCCRPLPVSRFEGLQHISIGATEMKSLLEVRPALSEAQLVRVDRMMEELEKQIPSTAEILEAEAVLAHVTLCQLGEGGNLMGGVDVVGTGGWTDGMGRGAVSWKQGFSVRTLAMAAQQHFDLAVGIARKTENLPWLQATREWDDFQERALQSGNVLSKTMLLRDLWINLQDCECRAQLRLLRAAARELLNTDQGWPEDPVRGGPLQKKPIPGGVRIWASGLDGDHGGEGNFHGLVEAGAQMDSVDQVIDVRK